MHQIGIVIELYNINKLYKTAIQPQPCFQSICSKPISFNLLCLSECLWYTVSSTMYNKETSDKLFRNLRNLSISWGSIIELCEISYLAIAVGTIFALLVFLLSRKRLDSFECRTMCRHQIFSNLVRHEL